MSGSLAPMMARACRAALAAQRCSRHHLGALTHLCASQQAIGAQPQPIPGSQRWPAVSTGFGTFATMALQLADGAVLAARRLDTEPVPFEDEDDEDEYEDGEWVDLDEMEFPEAEEYELEEGEMEMGGELDTDEDGDLPPPPPPSPPPRRRF